MVAADFDPATRPPPFVVQPHARQMNSAVLPPDVPDLSGHTVEEAEQLGMFQTEEPLQLVETKFERITLKWRAEAADAIYLDKGFLMPSVSGDAMNIDPPSPTKERSTNGVVGAKPRRASGPACTSLMPALQHVTLEDCIHMFTAPEDVDEDWLCSACKTRGRGTKRLALYKLPPILIVHMKRFKWLENPGGYSYHKKIDMHVEFSDVLELGAKDGAETGKYKLFAVVNHYGSSFSGHCELYLTLF